MEESKIKDSGGRDNFATGSVRDVQAKKGRMDLVPYLAVWMVSRIFEDGAIKYAENNWALGQPVKQYVKSALNHLGKYMEGMRDEPHLSMAGWNVLCALWTACMVHWGVYPKELGDMLTTAPVLSKHEEESLKVWLSNAPPPLSQYQVRAGKLPEQRGSAGKGDSPT